MRVGVHTAHQLTALQPHTLRSVAQDAGLSEDQVLCLQRGVQKENTKIDQRSQQELSIDRGSNDVRPQSTQHQIFRAANPKQLSRPCTTRPRSHMTHARCKTALEDVAISKVVQIWRHDEPGECADPNMWPLKIRRPCTAYIPRFDREHAISKATNVNETCKDELIRWQSLKTPHEHVVTPDSPPPSWPDVQLPDYVRHNVNTLKHREAPVKLQAAQVVDSMSFVQSNRKSKSTSSNIHDSPWRSF